MVDPAAPVKPKSKIKSGPRLRRMPSIRTDKAPVLTLRTYVLRASSSGGEAGGQSKSGAETPNLRDLTSGAADDLGRAAERSHGAVSFEQIRARVELVAGQQDEEREKPSDGHSGRWGLFRMAGGRPLWGCRRGCYAHDWRPCRRLIAASGESRSPNR